MGVFFSVLFPPSPIVWSALVRHRVGFAGVRVGEASGPGPAAPGAPVGGERPRRAYSRSPHRGVPAGTPVVHLGTPDGALAPRDPLVEGLAGLGFDERMRDACVPPPGPHARRVYCPVQGCPCSHPHSAPGWSSVASMRPHLQDHACGKLRGGVPADWLKAQGLGTCRVCSKILSERYGQACPRCRPKLVAPAPQTNPRVLSPGLPTLEQACTSRVALKRTVPKGARSLWAQCLVTALCAVLAHNDLKAWSELFALPKMVLPSSSRGGRSHAKRLEAETKRRCADWLEGKREHLWEAPQRQGKKRQKEPSAATTDPPSLREFEQRSKRVGELLKDGLLQQACRALVDEPPVDVNEQVLREMTAKHPGESAGEGDRLVQLPRACAAAAPALRSEQVEEALRSFGRGSGAGPSGLRPQHLKDALVPGWSDEVIRQLTAVTSLLLQGSACSEAQQWICGASLMALPKPTGDHRPVAVGETLRRLTSKVAAKAIAPQLRTHLEPVQLGVGSKNGCEAIVHTARQWLNRNSQASEKVLVTLDLSNAFNSINRSAFLIEVRRFCFELTPWLDFCYRGHSKLLLGDSVLSSSRGIQQGDPLGPAMFALGIHELVLRSKASTESAFPGELDWVAFFLDDGVAAGSGQAVKHFTDTLLAELRSIGLEANTSKCEAVSPAGAAGTAACTPFRGWQHVTTGGFKLLGAPLGEMAYVATKVADRVAKSQKLLKAVGKFGDKQGGLHLLRHCASWCKVIYTCRTVPPAAAEAQLAAYDDALRRTFEEMMARKVPDHNWSLCQLGLSRGGLGLRSPRLHAPAAYLASVQASRDLCSAIDPLFDLADPSGGLHRQQSWALLQERSLPHSPLRDVALADFSGSLGQKFLSQQVDAWLKTTIRSQSPDLDRHLSLVSTPGAGAWLTLGSSDDECRIDPPLFTVGLLRRARVPLFSGNEQCPLCGSPMDIYGDEALTCQCGGDRVVRHNACRDHMFAELKPSSLRVEREKAGLLPPRPSEDGSGLCAARQARRPADIWVAPASQPTPLALDFAVTSGLRPPLRTGAELAAIFKDYEDYKHGYQDTGQQCAAQGIAFTPMILEAHGGGFSPRMRQVIDMLAVEAAPSLQSSPAAVSLRIAQRISCALHRENARAVLRRLAPCSGGESGPTGGGWDCIPNHLRDQGS